MILEKAGLPDTEEKALMFQKAKDVLHEAGYLSVGLDHFVLPNDELSEALQSHRLHRNFQGYCTRRTTGQVYAFGVTGSQPIRDCLCTEYKVDRRIYSRSLCGYVAYPKRLPINAQRAYST